MNNAVNVKLVGVKPGRPPIECLLVDVQVKNDAKNPRRVLLPSYLPLAAGGIDKLEQLIVKTGAAGVAVGRFLGPGGLYAVRLGPCARVTLHDLEVAWWREEGAREVSFEVQMEAARHTVNHRAPGHDEVAVSVTGATSASMKLTPP